jgi:hypothetical protein
MQVQICVGFIGPTLPPSNLGKVKPHSEPGGPLGVLYYQIGSRPALTLPEILSILETLLHTSKSG